MVFEIIRDHPGIDHRLLAMEQHRHPLGAASAIRVPQQNGLNGREASWPTSS
jgi:hypothetical protein